MRLPVPIPNIDQNYEKIIGSVFFPQCSSCKYDLLDNAVPSVGLTYSHMVKNEQIEIYVKDLGSPYTSSS